MSECFTKQQVRFRSQRLARQHRPTAYDFKWLNCIELRYVMRAMTIPPRSGN
jgi:hypothetical protein